jgi:hypothetical protein
MADLDAPEGDPALPTDCDVCAHADAHAWIGQDGAHCRGCHRSWTSTAQAHCVICHEHFATNGVADLHWREGSHVHPSQVARLQCFDEAHGPVWRTGPGPQLPRIAPRGRRQSPATGAA